MTLWLLMTILCGAVAAIVAIPFMRGADEFGSDDAAASDVYNDQIKEIDRDQAAGAINDPEASVAKQEIQRRLNAAKKLHRVAKPLSQKFRTLVFMCTIGLIIVGSVGLYSQLGNPNLFPKVNTAALPAEVDAMIAKLVARAKANPTDAENWRILGWAQFSTAHYSEAVTAYSKASAIDPANTDYKSAWAEALILETQNTVTPKAQALLAEVLLNNPKDARARFYNAHAHEQSGDQSGALKLWMALLADSPADASWRGAVEQRIAELANATGRDVTKSFLPAPDANQKAQIQTLPETEQNAMIASMVERLAAKLKDNPKDVEGWINLMRSYQVLKESTKAQAALKNALAVFLNDPASQITLKQAASELGIIL